MGRRANGGVIGPANIPTTNSAGGIWSVFEQEYWNKAAAWPTAPTVPGAPTSVSANPGNAQATVSFTAPASTGGIAITSYTVTSSPGGFTASGASSPITVTGLTNGTTYTFTVVATNVVGSGPASSPSNSVVPVQFNNPSTVQILVVAGGGGGNNSNDSRLPGGAGGAGGYISNGSFSVSSGTFAGAYTVTVGAGGAAGAYAATKGGDSVFSGPNVTTQTAYGGGAGGNASSPASSVNNGGSGGGGGANISYYNGGRGVYPGSTYIDAPRQGYDGGGGGGFYGHGGGGGGAGGAGGSGPGGAGVSNSISGTSVTYAVGGTWPNTDLPIANTGNGGNTNGEFVPRDGATGVVIIKYPDSYDAPASTTGSPTVTVSGGYRIYKYTSSGSITFGGS